MKAAAIYPVIPAYNFAVIAITEGRIMVMLTPVTRGKEKEGFGLALLQLLFNVSEAVIRIRHLSGHGSDPVSRPGSNAGKPFHQTTHAPEKSPAAVCKRLVYIHSNQGTVLIGPYCKDRIPSYQFNRQVFRPYLNDRNPQESSPGGQRCGTRKPPVGIRRKREVFLIPRQHVEYSRKKIKRDASPFSFKKERHLSDK